MADRGIGHQPLDVALPDRGERAQRHRGDRDKDDDLLPLRDDAGKRRERHAGEHGERSDLGGGGKKRRHRRRRALIDVGRPHVERHRRNLEAEPREQEHQAEHEADATGLRGGSDAGKADGAGEAVDQGGAIEQHARRQRTEHEILQPGLDRLRVVPIAGGDHIECQRHQLEAEIEHDEIARRDQHHHAKCREQHQDRIFEDAPRRVGQEFRRQDEGCRRADQRQDFQEPGEIIDDEAAAESRELAGGQHPFQHASQD